VAPPARASSRRDGYILTNDTSSTRRERARTFPGGRRDQRPPRRRRPSTDLALLNDRPRLRRPQAHAARARLVERAEGRSAGDRDRQPLPLQAPHDGRRLRARTLDPAPNNFPIDTSSRRRGDQPGNSGDRCSRQRGVIASTPRSRRTPAPTTASLRDPDRHRKQVLPQLKTGREIKRPYLGVSTATPDTGTGAVVGQVVAGGRLTTPACALATASSRSATARFEVHRRPRRRSSRAGRR